jgi:hypothetical protein
MSYEISHVVKKKKKKKQLQFHVLDYKIRKLRPLIYLGWIFFTMHMCILM